jgi:hypothetical protein
MTSPTMGSDQRAYTHVECGACIDGVADLFLTVRVGAALIVLAS